MGDKVYPKTIDLSEGLMFNRLPRPLNFNRVSGTHPIYGRNILGFNRVGEHKIIVTLGAYTGDGCIIEPSAEAVVAVYGEIDTYVVNDTTNELAELWLKEN